eukprot:TRINITY_DN57482_c0_g1_i1.p1 TRINITY_DN57482_c0_g1~~TRINITY_DN57482_c0_g1_i1.p1  ORF type:complete len:447 (+),score=104.99 TRINITY_DN57482_c0_g1_i1:139-1341(+)
MTSTSVATPVRVPALPPEAKSLFLEWQALERANRALDLQLELCRMDVTALLQEEIAAQQEVQRICAPPILIGNFHEMITDDMALVGSQHSTVWYVPVLSTINRDKLTPNASVGLHRKYHSVVAILPPETSTNIRFMEKRPDVTYADIGDCDEQKQELREAIELPLTHGDLYRQLGIDPPKGVLLYGPPGTGKTMLVKALANASSASFFALSGSEFVQKYLGEGPRMVRDVFRTARENAPSIVFIDEIDAIGTKRFDVRHSADKEVQRILMELLHHMDGFDKERDDTVKVIMATNRADTLDPALLRPGRLDRKIHFTLPDRRQKRLIFQTVTKRMSMTPEVDLEDFINRPDKISGADIAAIAKEAGMQAVRKNRYVIMPQDLETAYKQVCKRQETEFLMYQ